MRSLLEFLTELQAVVEYRLSRDSRDWACRVG